MPGPFFILGAGKEYKKGDRQETKKAFPAISGTG